MKTTPRYFSYVWVVAMVMLAALLSACSTTMPIPVAPAATVASMKVEASSSAVTADTAQQRAKPAAGISVDEFVADLIKQIDTASDDKPMLSNEAAITINQTTRKDDASHTVVIKTPKKVGVEFLDNTKWVNTNVVWRWQIANYPDKQLDDAMPVIENDILIGWKISWHWVKPGLLNKTKPNLVGFGYILLASPFYVPADQDLNIMIDEIWPKAARAIPKDGVKLTCFNTKIVDNRVAVYGAWYRTSADDCYVDEKTGKVRSTKRYSDPAIALAEQQKLREIKVPLPTVVAMNADKYVIHPINEGEVVEMKPFEVNERTLPKSWITFTLYGVSPKSHEGLITAVVANKVDPEKPVGLAGVKDGMIIRSVNGVDPVGLTADKLNDILVPTSDEFVLEVSERKGSDLIRIAIPVSTFSDAAKRLASKKDAAAAPAATVAATTDP